MIHHIQTCLPGYTQSFGTLSLGESMIWQCGKLSEFESIILPQVVLNNEDVPITYLYFSQVKPFVFKKKNVSIYFFNLDDSFESFTFRIYDQIQSSPNNSLFVFDCLSMLQASWCSDMMIANFFRIIIPILAAANSSGFFPLLRGKHSYSAIRSLMKSAAVFMDIQKQGKTIRLRRLDGRSAKETTLYYHKQQDGALELISQPAGLKFAGNLMGKRTPDIWSRYFSTLKILSQTGTMPEQEYQKLCRRLMTKEPQMADLIIKHFTVDDYLTISRHMIGTGQIGGKACGFLLGRKLLDTSLPDVAAVIEPHDTYYIGTDVFCTYMVENNCWQLRLKYRLEKEQFQELKAFREAMAVGSFPAFIRNQFLRMLKHYGSTPIIVRSSSFMEDGYGNAFSGKYESVFCANQGTLRERLYEFEQAVRQVYASTLSTAALEYRSKRSLLGLDEQMALLVQSVSGKRYGDLYFPIASGVSFSYNPYRWMEQINPEAGMIRLVAGMGTRAVNRTPGDYPRLIGLDRPQAMFWPTIAERHQYSQRFIDVLNLNTKTIESLPFEDILPLLPPGHRKYIFSHDTDAEDSLRERGQNRQVFFTDCQGVVDHSGYINLMKAMLQKLEQLYQRPVDIEFALTIRADGTIGIDLLQCRPLQHRESRSIAVRNHRDEDVLFEISKASMRSSKQENLDIIVVVDPRHYYETPYAEKGSVASAIGELNQLLDNKKAMLLVPGRIGTSSPELGVPVNYSEVNQFEAICEVSYHDIGYDPELSYGSHMFQDMVEADVFYGAIHENSSTRIYRPGLLQSYPNIYDRLLPGHPEYRQIIQVYDLQEQDATLYLDAVRGHALCIITNTAEANRPHSQSSIPI